MKIHCSLLVLAVIGGVVAVTDAGTSAQSLAWESVGPRPPAIITPIVVGSIGSGEVVIATFGGGVLKSRDDGRTFDAANDGLTNLAIAALAADPTDARHLYAATFGAGTFHSTNGGGQWAPLAATPSLTLTIAIDPRHRDVLYMGLLGGPRLIKSIDGGVTWSNANQGLPIAPVWGVRVDPENSNILYAATGGGGGFKSVNGGASWDQLPLPTNLWAIAFDPRDSRIIYVGTDGQGVYRSFDAGATFAEAGFPGNGHVLSLAVDPARQGVVYAGTLNAGVEVSEDFARTFRPTALNRGSAIALTSSDTGEVYVGTGFSGVHKSGSYGARWSPVAADTLNALNGQSIYGLTVDPLNSARVLAATNEGGLFETTNGGRTWGDANAGLTTHTPRTAVFDPADPQRVYAGSLYGGGLFVSSNAGRLWSSRRFGPGSIYIYAVDVGPDRTVYAGTVGDGLWRSTDLGGNFTRVTNTPFNDAQAVSVDPTNPAHVLVGGGQGLFRTLDSGATWTRLLTAFTTNVVFDSRRPGVVYASTQTIGVQRSTDGGATFSPLNNGLTNLRASRGAGVIIDPRNSDVLYLGTEGGGIFKSRDAGASWFPINHGLSNLNVFALTIDPRNPDILYAGGGSSVFKTTTGGEATRNYQQ